MIHRMTMNVCFVETVVRIFSSALTAIPIIFICPWGLLMETQVIQGHIIFL